MLCVVMFRFDGVNSLETRIRLTSEMTMSLNLNTTFRQLPSNRYLIIDVA